jgi:hypothetical protein
MKKLILLAVLLCLNLQVQANEYTDDVRIISALEVLQEAGATDVFERLDESDAKIIFYDLSLMSYSYAKDYAITSTDEYGDNYILINERYRNAPKEAIACLIAHESVHMLPKADFNEEVRAFKKEAETWDNISWRCLNLTNLDENTSRLIKRLNSLKKIYKIDGAIEETIRDNSFYNNRL